MFQFMNWHLLKNKVKKGKALRPSLKTNYEEKKTTTC